MARATRASRGGKAEEEPAKKEESKKEESKKEEPKKKETPKKSAAPKKAIKATAAAAAKEEAAKKAAADKKKAEEAEPVAEAEVVEEKEEEPEAKPAPKKRGRGKREKDDSAKEKEEAPAKKDDKKEEAKEESKEETEKPASKKAKKDDKKAAAEEKKEEEKEEVIDDANAIWSPTEFDVLSGRGASVNSHGVSASSTLLYYCISCLITHIPHLLLLQGNKKFRALCFARKPEFEAGNHAAKRRIATEIVDAVFNGGEARFLKRNSEKGPWLELNKEQAILKACQVMRDYKRPDRLAIREMMMQNGQARKRSRQVESTPMLDIVSTLYGAFASDCFRN